MMPQDPSNPNQPDEPGSYESGSGDAISNEDLLSLEEQEYGLESDALGDEDQASEPLWFADLLDGRLDREQARIREAALEEDPELKHRYDLYASTVQKLRDLGQDEARESSSPFLKARILASIQASVPASVPASVVASMDAELGAPEKARGRGVFRALVASTGLAAAALLGMLYILEQSPKTGNADQPDFAKEESSIRLDEEEADGGLAARGKFFQDADDLAKARLRKGGGYRGPADEIPKDAARGAAPGSSSASQKAMGGRDDFAIGRGKKKVADLKELKELKDREDEVKQLLDGLASRKAVLDGEVDNDRKAQGFRPLMALQQTQSDQVLLFAVELAPQQASALEPQLRALEGQRFAFSAFAAGLYQGSPGFAGKKSGFADKKSVGKNKKKMAGGPRDAVPVIPGGGRQQKWGRIVSFRDLYGPSDFASTSNVIDPSGDEVVVLRGPEDQLIATLALLFQRSERHAIAFVPKASLIPVEAEKESLDKKVPKMEAATRKAAKRKAAEVGRTARRGSRDPAPGKPDERRQAGQAAVAKKQDRILEIRVLIRKQRHPVPGRSGMPGTPSSPTPGTPATETPNPKRKN